jgi:hypothetical protein
VSTGKAPLNLIAFAQAERMTDVPTEGCRLFVPVDTGFIGPNVFPFRASEGLGSVFPTVD